VGLAVFQSLNRPPAALALLILKPPLPVDLRNQTRPEDQTVLRLRDEAASLLGIEVAPK